MPASYNLSTVGVRAQQESISGRGSTVSFHGLRYFVNAPATDKRCSSCRSAPKQILHDVSGIFRPGLNAIMGATGSGKTTLLDTLAGCTDPSGVRGTVLVDGQKRQKNFRFMTGYVLQDDVVVMGTLTVRENLMFSANLRLAGSLPQNEKRNRVEELLQELGLTSCADTKVGTEYIRGVSGGERKRTNIGMELVIGPSVLFLDEPTTGLDSSTASSVVSLLHRLSTAGRAIIFSIHQPRFAIFNLFDRLSLLADGRTVFHGPASQALTFFQSVGYVCKENNNPPDFFLDVMSGDSTAAESQPVQSTVKNNRQSVAEDLSAKFSASKWAKEAADELRPIMAAFESTRHRDTTRRDHYVTSFFTQLGHVSKRAFQHASRNPETSLLQVALSVSFALLVGTVFLQLHDDDTYPSGLQNRTGVLFLLITYQMLSNLTTLEVFIQQRVIFIHESARGFYRVSVYFVAKTFCDLIPMRIIPLCPFSVIAYFMIGFRLDLVKFVLFCSTLFMTALGGAAVCFAVSATVRTFAVANLVSAFVFVVMMIFGGLLVNITTLGDWLSWLQYFSITRFSLNALSISELDDMTFYVTGVNGTRIPAFTGSQHLEEQGIDHDTEWDFWKNILAVGMIVVGLLCISYIQLRRIKKLK